MVRTARASRGVYSEAPFPSSDPRPRALVAPDTSRGIRSAQLGIVINAGLAITKLIAGLVGNTYALVADAVESTADVVSSLIVWAGLRLAGRGPDDAYPFGYGKAEALAAGAVALMMLLAALGIAAVRPRGLDGADGAS